MTYTARLFVPPRFCMQHLPRLLSARLPFFYGWVVLGCAMCATFARQGSAVATLSVFIVPMTREFDWSRAEISAPVSLGGVLAAFVTPYLGAFVDRAGTRAVLVTGTILITLTAAALAFTQSLLWFFIAFTLGRLVFAGPFELGTSAAVTSWFVRRRPLAMAWLTVSVGLSLAAMPMIGQFAIDREGWRAGWIVIAVAVLVIGALPNALLMVRRPEDIGLRPDGNAPTPNSRGTRAALRDQSFTRAEALRTPAFWLLMMFTGLIFPVQAGVSLHQAPHLIERGIDPTTAASIIGTFAIAGAVCGFGFGWISARWPVRFGLAAAAAISTAGTWLMLHVTAAPLGYVAAFLFGAGIGGVLTLVPVAFADYFGRHSYGAIRGIALPVQVIGQASGPIIAGVLRDVSGDYTTSLATFTTLGVVATALVLLASPPPTRTVVPPD